MKYVALLIVLSACATKPAPYHYVSDQDQAAQDRCEYVGRLHQSDDGGVGAQLACLRYYSKTGELPPTQ